MRFDWLDEMVADGRLEKTAADRIYSEANSLIEKLAKSEEEIMALSKKIAPWIAGALGVGGALVYDKVRDASDGKKIMANLASIVNKFDKDEDKEKAKARFEEIGKISPNVAMNENLASKLVHTRLHDGLSAEDAQRLALLELNYRSSGIIPSRIFSGGPKMASDDSVTPAEVGSVYADAFLVVKTASLASGFNLFKNKALTDWAKAFALLTSVPLGVAAVGGAVKHVTSKIDKKEMDEKLRASFDTAVERSDHEREPLKDNPEKARQAFQALAHFAPHVAMQPDAARHFMSKVVSYDQGITTGDARDLSEIESNLRDIKEQNPFIEGFKNTAKGLGIPKTLEGGFEQASRHYSDGAGIYEHNMRMQGL